MPAEVEAPLMENKKKGTAGKFFLVDGHSFCYRAYYAIRQLSNSRGEPTNAIYGFVTMLRKLIEQYKPDHVAICFDHASPTFRHERYKDYKAHRSPMPEDLAAQIEPIKEFCRAYRYSIFERPGYEADDVIGTLAVKGESRGYDVFIITGDKDAMQLVSEHIRILNPHKEGLVIGRAEVKKRFEGLGPEKVVEVMALMGDASDNIPGIPGIGEKTAVKLIQEFGSVENLVKYAGKIKAKRQQEQIRKHEADALLSKDLARIDTAVDFEIDWDALTLTDPDEKKLKELAQRYEFRTLLKDLKPQSAADKAERRYLTVTSEDALKELVRDLEKQDAFSFDTETTHQDPMRAHLVGMSFCWEPYRAFYVPVSMPQHRGEGMAVERALHALRGVLENAQIGKFGQNVKYDAIVMERHGVQIRGVCFDTMIASYLVNPVKLNHNLDDIALEYLGLRKIQTSDLLGSGRDAVTMDEVSVEKVSQYACEDADCVQRLVPVLQKKLEEHGLEKLFREVEMPLAFVLAEVERTGVYLDVKMLEELSAKASEELGQLTRDIYREAGEEFNINSTKQLAEILFEKLKYPAVKKTKTGYSTDVSVLEKLAQDYALAGMLLEYREKTKLKSTYLDALPGMVNPETGAVHTSYHQTTTVTGRLSSSDPNLQNIPIKTQAGRLVRKAFVARPRTSGRGRILSADYSQIELRILAHFSSDEQLLKAFREERDIHTFTATLLYGVSEKEVTREMRGVAKTINFSIIYGKTAFGLSQDLHIPVGEADQFIRNYFDRYSGIRAYLESQKERAREQGFLTTLLGRRAYFPDINSKNVPLRQFAERAAINAPIQGSAADLIKLAMIRIEGELVKRGLESRMIMQVHDELVFDGPEDEMKALEGMVREGMEKAYELRVPLRADFFIGDSWYKN